MPTTIGRWIDLPASGGADDRFRPDQPLGAGLMQIAASNATLAARENGLGVLFEHPGAVDVQGGLDFGTDPAEAFPWDAYPSASTPLVICAGVHRIRTWGETSRYPKVMLAGELIAGGGSTAGIILVGRPTMGRPSPSDRHVSVITTASVSVSVELPTLYDFHVESRLVLPVTGNAIPTQPPVEEGRHTEMAFYIGVWNGTGGKTTIGSLTLYLAPP